MAAADRRPRRGTTRRDWLRYAAAVPLAGLAACGDGGAKTAPVAGSAPATKPASVPGGPKPSVLIIGGGLCGLRLLGLLRSRGHEASLLEGWTRLGGRVYTVSHGSLRVELGAERTTAFDARVHALAAEARAELVAYPPPNRPTPLRFGALKTTLEDPSPELLAGLSDAEKRLGPHLVHLSLIEGATSPADDDSRNAARWLKDLGLGERGEALVRAFTYHDIDALPAAAFARFARRERDGLQSTTIAGGSVRLVDALHGKVARYVERGFVAASAEETTTGVKISSRDGLVRTADLAVFAVSAAALDRIRFVGGTPKSIAERLSGLAMGHELKISGIVPAAAEAAAGFALADRFPRATWPMPERDPDRAFVFNTMAVREDLPAARAAASAGTGALARYMEEVLPELKAHQPRWFTHDWQSDPLIGGAYAFAKSTAGLATGPVAAGRFRVAGADFSTLPGWMEGALESAEAVAEMLVG